MADKLLLDKALYQEEALHEIRIRFGQDFLTNNNNGNLVLHPKLLAAFRKITSGRVVWVNDERLWRERIATDAETRGQNG